MKAPGKNVSNKMKTNKDNLSEQSRDIASDLSRLGSFDEILEYLITHVTQMLEADRGSLFLHDPGAHQLYTRVALGNLSREIRIDEQSGVAGWVFMNAESAIVNSPYNDERFNKEVDERTGYQTKSLVCVPIFSTGDIPIGVLQVLNKQKGKFTKADLAKIELVASQCASTLNTYALTERMEAQKRREAEFMELVSKLTTELDLSRLLNHVVDAATDMLVCERATVFLNDEKTDELFSMVGAGLGAFEIRLPNNAGISGAVFQSGENVNIPHAYADLRFNPSFDKQTGFFTRSVLCVPILNKEGKRIGVTQALNKIGGPFTEEDEHRIQAFTAQISVGLENAKMFNDMQAVKNYNEAMLHSMSNGVITVDEEGNLKSINASAEKIVQLSSEENLGKPLSDVLDKQNGWLLEKINKVRETGETENLEDADLITGEGNKVSANIALQPMISGEGENIGALILVEDISSEKRVRSTMSRYMDPQLANQLLEEGDGQDMLGGKASEATVLFTDIRSFTTIAEALGPQDTVSMLNEYFEIMVACISDAGGMLDKFIGDAIM
ncbi:MAG: GAF domain-containing protein, partial [Pseudomonadota bacterium]|nr:GAF domain-containing protein [Pseudomonadota bacterium]